MKRLKEYSNKIIGRQIKKYRLSKGYSIKKLSELTGISESYIHGLEHGGVSESSSVSMEKICKISNSLGVSLDDLAYTNMEYAVTNNNSLINEISIELKSLSEADLLLFDKIVNIFMPDKKRKLN